MMNKSIVLIAATLSAVCVMTASADERGRGPERNHFHERRPGAIQRVPHARVEIDARFGHNRYYPRPGIGYRVLPSGYYTTHYRGVPYYFHEGIWYRHNGPGYVVIRPPVGLFVNVLPPFYTSVWFGGMRYYYADNVYYRWDPARTVYVVSDPPNGAPDNTSTSGSEQTFVYPKNGQSEEQTAKDRYDCYRWAADQSGFDPTKVAGGVNDSDSDNKRDEYKRAEAACLDARGYSVK